MFIQRWRKVAQLEATLPYFSKIPNISPFSRVARSGAPMGKTFADLWSVRERRHARLSAWLDAAKCISLGGNSEHDTCRCDILLLPLARRDDATRASSVGGRSRQQKGRDTRHGGDVARLHTFPAFLSSYEPCASRNYPWGTVLNADTPRDGPRPRFRGSESMKLALFENLLGTLTEKAGFKKNSTVKIGKMSIWYCGMGKLQPDVPSSVL